MSVEGVVCERMGVRGRDTVEEVAQAKKHHSGTWLLGME